MHLVIHSGGGADFSQLSSFITWVVLIGAVYGFLRLLHDLYVFWLQARRPGGRPPE